MIVLSELGGIKVYGHGAAVFKRSNGTFGGIHFTFDSDVFYPSVENNVLELPYHSGQPDYQIHVLASGDILIMKDGSLYHCTVDKGEVRVREYIPTFADRPLLTA